MLLGDVLKLAKGMARSMERIRRDLEDVFGAKLTPVDIEDLKRQAELDRAERDASERRQLIEEWQAAERQRLEEEQALEEERMRAIRLGQDPSSRGSTLPSRLRKVGGRGWQIPAHHRVRRVP